MAPVGALHAVWGQVSSARGTELHVDRAGGGNMLEKRPAGADAASESGQRRGMAIVSRLLLGTAVGVLPGIGPAMTVALLLPITYNVSPSAAFIMFAGIFYGGMYGGSTTSILLNTPGESSSVITAPASPSAPRVLVGKKESTPPRPSSPACTPSQRIPIASALSSRRVRP